VYVLQLFQDVNSVLTIKDRSTAAVNSTLLKVKVKFFLEQATKTQRGSRGIALRVL
jgi:hypothetical protein